MVRTFNLQATKRACKYDKVKTSLNYKPWNVPFESLLALVSGAQEVRILPLPLGPILEEPLLFLLLVLGFAPAVERRLILLSSRFLLLLLVILQNT